MLGFVRPFWEVLFRRKRCEGHWRCRSYLIKDLDSPLAWLPSRILPCEVTLTSNCSAWLRHWIDFYLKLCYTYVSNRVVLLSYFSFSFIVKILELLSFLERTFFTKCTFSLLYLTENLFDVIVYWLIITLSHSICRCWLFDHRFPLQGSDLWLLYPFQSNSLLIIVSHLRWWSFDHYLFS